MNARLKFYIGPTCQNFMLTANISLLDGPLDDKTALIAEKSFNCRNRRIKKMAKFSLILTFLNIVGTTDLIPSMCISTYVRPLPRESAMEYKMLFFRHLSTFCRM